MSFGEISIMLEDINSGKLTLEDAFVKVGDIININKSKDDDNIR